MFLTIVMILGLLSGCGGNPASVTKSTQGTTASTQNTEEPTTAVTSEKAETAAARELGIIPRDWEGDLSAEADFAGFDQMVTSLILLCEEDALSVWQKNVASTAFPGRPMRRDDGLVLLMLAAEALGYNVYNARDYGFCTENYVDYDLLFSQLSWDYPYCDAEREIPMFFPDGGEDPIGNVPTSAVSGCSGVWM